MNLDVLLAPLSGDHPCGEDLSFSTDFDQIADMRREDDPTLAQGEWVTALKVADWPGVAERCQLLLGTRSKDLRLAQWLTEAWCHTDSFVGMARGLQICQALCASYWDGLHPQPDDGDMEQRIGNVTWLLHRLAQLMPTLPWVQSRQGPRYSLRDWQLGKQPAPLAADASQTIATGPSLDQFMRALKDTPANHLSATVAALDEIQQQLRSWQDLIDAQLGQDGPSFVAVKDALDLVSHEVRRLIKETGGLPEAAVPMVLPSGAAEPAHAALLTVHHPAHRGPIDSRAQALQQLREVAAFFRRTEPHSPVAYLAEKAVKWGDMPLHEWLRQVIKDQGALTHLDELLGTQVAQTDASTTY